MKKLLIIVIPLITIYSCKKPNNTSPGGNNGNTNATEQQFIGTWYLQKLTDSAFYNSTDIALGARDTVVTINSYPISANVQFNSAAEDGKAGYFQCTDACGLSAQPVYYADIIDGSTAFASIACYWKFDGTNNLLTVLFSTYNVISISSSDMVLNFNLYPHHTYLFLHK